MPASGSAWQYKHTKGFCGRGALLLRGPNFTQPTQGETTMNTFSFGRKHRAAGMAVLVLLLGAILTSAQTADAQEIVNFTANPVNGLEPGTELIFRLEGSPQARASVSINGIRQPISL